MSNDLTVLVFLKDRSDFTKRLCQYLSLIQYPYTVLFSDGSICDENEYFFKNIKNKNLDFNFIYKRYPKDISLEVFYKKCYESISEIKTPYVMLADNDDFLFPDGQKICVAFLRDNRDYVGCNGRVSGILLSPEPEKPYGDHIQYLSYYCNVMDAPMAVDQEHACARIKSHLNNFYSIFYSVFKTESMVNTFNKILEFNFSELGIFELFFSQMQLAQGKIKTIPNITYVRQKGSSQTAVTQKDWFYRLFYTTWMKDCQKSIDCVAGVISRRENLEKKLVYDEIYSNLVNRMRSRYLLNEVYFFKNVSKLLEKEMLRLMLFSKVFKVFPNIGEYFSQKILSKFGCIDNFKAVQAVIKSERFDLK
jgi:glycosyltransferase domain-containing protein